MSNDIEILPTNLFISSDPQVIVCAQNVDGVLKKYYGYTLRELLSRTNSGEARYMRRALMVIARRRGCTYHQSAAILGRKNHTTAINSMNKHKYEYGVYDDYTEIYDGLNSKFK